MRVSTQKIDDLTALAETLMIYAGQMTSAKQNGEDILPVQKLAKEIRNLSMSFRMVSLKSLFLRVQRIGRDTIRELQKNAEIVLVGEETEIDRSVVEILVDPLVHLIKNSIYHGIEDERSRLAHGKSAIGQVKIEAYRQKGYVDIVISDDGRGMEPQALLQNAIDKNLVDPFLDYSEQEILSFIFLPGFSTVQTADNISGRGVGLDVVKTQITKLGGKVEVRNTTGQGCSFILRMPILLSLLNGIAVRIADSKLIIPTHTIACVFRAGEDTPVTVQAQTAWVKYRDEVIPVLDVNKVLGLPMPALSDCMLVLLESEGKLLALPVDEIQANKDFVVRPLGDVFNHLPYAFGASILSDGTVAVILDVDNLGKECE